MPLGHDGMKNYGKCVFFFNLKLCYLKSECIYEKL